MAQRLPRFASALERISDQQKLGRILLEAESEESQPGNQNGGGKMAAGSTPPADGRRLRGIPAIGRGVGGAIGGSDPLRAVLLKEKRGESLRSSSLER